MGVFIDLTGQKFGRLTVIKYNGKTKGGVSKWICLCKCGRRISLRSDNLKNSHTKSCGCLRNKHGHCKNRQRSRTYISWEHMIDRCSNPNHIHYKYYGGRGIKVCKRWSGKNGFINFLQDMGSRPKNKSLDRTNNNKGYYKSNCEWTKYKDNNRNRNNNRNYLINNKNKCISALAEEHHIARSTLENRIRRGWPIKKALNTPVKKYKRK